jgi:hypothetical protein
MKQNKVYCIETFDGMFGTFHKNIAYIISKENVECFYILYREEDMIDYNNKSKRVKLSGIAPGMTFYKRDYVPDIEDMVRTIYFDDYFIDIKKLRKLKLNKINVC